MWKRKGRRGKGKEEMKKKNGVKREAEDNETEERETHSASPTHTRRPSHYPSNDQGRMRVAQSVTLEPFHRSRRSSVNKRGWVCFGVFRIPLG